jgi:4-nitrophenyl phosphatase
MPGFLIDLDGTLYRGTEVVEYAAEFIEQLHEKKLPYYYLTNNAARTPETVADQLRSLGIRAKASDVITSAQAAATYIARNNQGSRVFCVGEQGLILAMQEAGLAVTDERPDYVVQGLDRQFTYDKLKQAVRFILAGAEFVLTNPDLLLPTETGLSPAAGSIAAAIEAASGHKPVLIGKPSKIIMDYAIERVGLEASDIWVVGDNLATDIAGGVAAGCKTALILTGVTTRDNKEELIRRHGVSPDATADHLMDFQAFLS